MQKNLIEPGCSDKRLLGKGWPVYHSIAADGDLLGQVYAMRYQSYYAQGYIAKNSTESFIDEYDEFPNSTSFLIYSGSKALGSIRTSVFDPQVRLSVPTMEVFYTEIGAHLGFNSPFVEANKFVVNPGFQQRGGVRARFHIFRNIVEKAIESGSESIITAVRPEHVKFYDLLYFYPISKIKNYPHLSFKTILLVCEDIELLKKKIWKKTGN